MCRGRLCFSAFKYGLGTFSLCLGPESKLQVSHSCTKEGAKSLCRFWLGRHLPATPATGLY